MFFALRFKAQPLSNSSTPPPIPIAQAAQPTVAISPDGKMTLTTMRFAGGKEGTVYTFLVTDESSGIQRKIFTKTEVMGTILSIPDNTFSSDNKYVFLKEADGVRASYLILSTNVSPDFLNTPINVSSLFAAKYQNYIITDVTGWGGPTLLIINTDKTSGGIGPTFWFDVASSSFIQLSTRFN